MTTKIRYDMGFLTILVLAILVLLILPYSGGLLYSLILNTIFGFIAIFLLNAIFGLDIRYDLLVLVFVAIFGLLAVAVLVILNLLGTSTKSTKIRTTTKK